jgi:hypothetical protein
MHAARRPWSWLIFDVSQKMKASAGEPLQPDEQMEALATLSLHRVLAAHGKETFDHRKHLSVSRADMEAFFQRFPEKAEALLQTNEKTELLHDIDRMERRDGKFVVYWIDHGAERFHKWYKSLPEAAADYVASQFGYPYPDAKKG